MTAVALRELVSYVPDAARADLLPTLRADWPTAHGALSVSTVLQHVDDPSERARIRGAARDFESRALEIVRRDALPAGDLAEHIVIVAGGGLELHAGRGELKLRIDESMALVAMRRRAVRAAEGEDALSRLRRELADVLSVPVTDAAAPASELRDLSDVATGAICVRLTPADGMGLARGRYDAIEVYGDGRALLVGLVRPPYSERCDLPQAAPSAEIDLGSLEEPKVGSPGTGEPPKRGALSRKWTPADNARVEFNRAAAAESRGTDVPLGLDDAGHARDERVDLLEWQAGAYDAKEEDSRT